jgi:hypothetical protein
LEIDLLKINLFLNYLFGDFIINFCTNNLFPLYRSVKIKNRLSSCWATLSPIHLALLTPLLKSPPLLKMPNFNKLSISFSFNNATIFCINICVLVLINHIQLGFLSVTPLKVRVTRLSEEKSNFTKPLMWTKQKILGKDLVILSSDFDKSLDALVQKSFDLTELGLKDQVRTSGLGFAQNPERPESEWAPLEKLVDGKVMAKYVSNSPD